MKQRTRPNFTSSRVGSYVSLLCLVFALGCLDPYTPPGVRDVNLLVVDGFLNSSTGLARVKLTRSLTHDSQLSYPIEQGAEVIVESDEGVSFAIPEVVPGS